MPVTDVTKDPDQPRLVITADLDCTVPRAWQLWADPRQLERWWGPPTYPATVVDHDLTPGGRVSYYMTGPDEQQYKGWWTVLEVEPPNRLVVQDGFADEDGRPVEDLPTSSMTVTLHARDDGGTRMVITSTWASREAMEQVLKMGAVEGMTDALGQIDDLLAEGADG